MKIFFLVLSLLVLSLTSACTKKEPAVTEAATPSYLTANLIDQEGQPFQLKQLEGQNVLVSFMFTHCPLPEACPLTLELNKRLSKKWSGTAKKPKLHFVLATLDPANDSPAVLKKYAKTHGLSARDFTLVTGDEKTLSDFASQLANVVGFATQGLISHNVKSVLLNPKLEIIAEYKDNNWKADQVLEKIRESSNTNPS